MTVPVEGCVGSEAHVVGFDAELAQRGSNLCGSRASSG